jgi:hypothetical protein
MPNAHAKLSPSAGKRWLNCPGSVALCEDVVDSGGADADQGTACHSILQLRLEGKAVPEKINIEKEEGGEVTVVPVTKEMLHLVDPVYDWIISYKEKHNARIFSEQKVEIGAPAFGIEPGILWGTSDVIAHGDELAVMDAKFGYSPVAVEANEQLILYALGAMYASAWMFDTIRLVILQPRDSVEPKGHVYTGADLMKFEAEYAPKVLAALHGGPLVPSEGACRWCRAAGPCPALRDQVLQLARREFKSALTMTPEEISDLLLKSEMIEGAIAAVKLHATKLAEMGTSIPGFKLVKGEKKRTWVNEEEAPKHLKKLGLSEDEVFEKKLVTPASAERDLADRILAKSKVKITKKYALEQAKVMVGELAFKPEGLPTLVREADSREALPPAFTLDDVKALEAPKEQDITPTKPVDGAVLFD